MKAAGLLYVFFAAVYMLASPGVLNNPDSGTRMLTALTLARHGTVEIAAEDFPDLELAGYELGQNGRGRWVEMFNDGQAALLAVPLALLEAVRPLSRHEAEFFTAAVFFPLLSALTPVAFWLLLRMLSPATPRENLGACLLLGLSTCSLVYAYNGHQEMQVALLLIAQTGLVIRHLRHGGALSLVGAGACLGAILLLRYSCLPLAAVSAAWLAWGHRRSPARAAGAVALLAATGLLVYLPQLYWNYVKTGDPLALPIVLWKREPAWIMSLPPLEGLGICLASPAESLFLYNPIALVSLGAAVGLWSRFRREEYFPLYLYAALMFVALCGWIAWRGEIAWGPRIFVHMSFLMVLPSWLLLRHGPPGSGRLVLAAGLLGFGVQILGTLYASENDYGAQRLRPGVYGAHRGPSFVPYLAYRAGDLARLATRGEPFVPARFEGLPRPQGWTVPQWWWVRLWLHPEYGVSRPAVLVLLTPLLLGLLGSAVALSRLARR